MSALTAARCTTALTMLTLATFAGAQPTMPGDVALATYTDTNLYDGAGVQYDTFTNALVSVEFDNSGGVLHNASGNLLGLRATNRLVQLATDGSFMSSLVSPPIVPAGHELSGLSVSPDNTHVAVVDRTAGRVVIADYMPGAVGTGTGATIGSPVASPPILTPGRVIGTAWLDDDHVLVFDPGGTMFQVDLAGAPTVLGSTGTPGYPYENTEVEYNPLISPYVYVLYAGDSGACTYQNTLYVLDPASWSLVVAPIDFSASMGWAFEMALGAGGELFVNQGCGTSNVIDVIPGAAIPASILPNSSLDWPTTPGLASIPGGIDVASSLSPPPACYADCDANGVLSILDFICFSDRAASGDPYADCDGNGLINILDFICFQTEFVAGCP